MSDRVPVIYVLSSGRSGTTLLDLLLGSASRAWTVGEAQLLPWELREERAPCGCGRPVDECPFWRQVRAEAPLGEGPYPIEHFRESYGAGQVLRWRLLPDLLRGKVGGPRRRSAAAYGRVNADYLRAVRQEAEALSGRSIRWLVDASMDPYRLLWLQDSGRFELRVIHLTKAPPAFVYSMVRNRLPGGRRRAVRMAGRWLVENALMVRLCRIAFPDDGTRHVRYEDLAGRPSEVRREMGAWLDLELPAWSGRTFRAYENHAISGNEMRWSDTNIRLDQRWRSELPPLHRTLSNMICAPLAGRLGY